MCQAVRIVANEDIGLLVHEATEHRYPLSQIENEWKESEKNGLLFNTFVVNARIEWQRQNFNEIEIKMLQKR